MMGKIGCQGGISHLTIFGGGKIAVRPGATPPKVKTKYYAIATGFAEIIINF